MSRSLEDARLPVGGSHVRRLARRAALAGTDGQVFEIGGPEVVSYGDLMRRYARLRGLRRLLPERQDRLTVECRRSAPSGSTPWSSKSPLQDATKDNGHIGSLDRHVSPRSLYLAQLRDRLGDAAVRQIAVPGQRADV